jgi:hypothetical protein
MMMSALRGLDGVHQYQVGLIQGGTYPVPQEHSDGGNSRQAVTTRDQVLVME